MARYRFTDPRSGKMVEIRAFDLEHAWPRAAIHFGWLLSGRPHWMNSKWAMSFRVETLGLPLARP